MRRTTCRLCGSDQLETYLDLGLHPPSDAFTKTRDEPQTYYPLDVNLCRACGHSQLGYVVPPETLFGEDYPYEANTTSAGRAHWAELGRTATVRIYGQHIPGLGMPPLMVDIGGNVGELCRNFSEHGWNAVNVEPAGVAAISKASGTQTVERFWTEVLARELLEEHGPAWVITATNVFAHVDDLDDFCRGAKRLLHPQGALVIEVPWFRNLLALTEYDTIYHEHLSYVTVGPLLALFRRHGLEVFDVGLAQIHGGSIRIWVGHEGSHTVTESVGAVVRAEGIEGTADLGRLAKFAQDVAQNRTALRRLMDSLDGSVAAVSAPAKGMTLLNYAGLTSQDIAFVSEKSALKIGRYTPGGRIPVVSDAELLGRAPDNALLLAWNWAEEIMSGLKGYKGRWLVPIPHPRVVSRSSTPLVADRASV